MNTPSAPDSPTSELEVRLSVNGRQIRRRVEARMHLADFLRHELQLTATHVGCEHGVCGACTVRVDGEIVRGCLVLAAQVDGCEVTTLEGLDASGAIADLQQAFVRHAQIRDHLSGNYCRCTGYHAIVSAVAEVAQQRLDAAGRAGTTVDQR